MNYFMMTLNVVSHMFMLSFFFYFTEHKYNYERTVISLFIMLLCFVFLELLRCLFFFPSRFVTVLVTLPEIILMQLTVIWLSESDIARAIFTGINGACYVLAGNVSGVMVQYLTKNYTIGLVTAFTIDLIILVVLVETMQKHYLEMIKNDTVKWNRLCCIPAMVYVCIYSLIVYPSSISTTPENGIAAAILILLMFISYALIFCMVRTVVERDQLEHSNELIRAYAQGLEKESAVIHKCNERVAVIRHDLKHFVVMLSGLLEEEDYEGIRTVLKKYGSAIDEQKVHIYCENAHVNSILNCFVARAQTAGVSLKIKTDIPQNLPVDSMEFAVVMANLLENAVNAAGEIESQEKYIDVYAHRVNHQLIVDITNTYCGNLLLNESTGLPVSEKGELHGFGMRSVSAFATKYNLIFDCAIEDRVFHARLLMADVD